jgi:hypothetical protein
MEIILMLKGNMMGEIRNWFQSIPRGSEVSIQFGELLHRLNSS